MKSLINFPMQRTIFSSVPRVFRIRIEIAGNSHRKVFFCLTGPYLTRRATIGRLANPPLAEGGSFATSLRATAGNSHSSRALTALTTHRRFAKRLRRSSASLPVRHLVRHKN